MRLVASRQAWGRSLAVLVGLAAAAYGLHRVAATTEARRGPITVVYVGADDCAPCRIWRSEHRPALVAALGSGRLALREIVARRTAEAFDSSRWPDDLRAYRAEAAAIGGVPLWIVLRGDRPVLAAGGLSQWRARVAPRLGLEARS